MFFTFSCRLFSCVLQWLILDEEVLTLLNVVVEFSFIKVCQRILDWMFIMSNLNCEQCMDDVCIQRILQMSKSGPTLRNLICSVRNHWLEIRNQGGGTPLQSVLRAAIAVKNLTEFFLL